MRTPDAPADTPADDANRRKCRAGIRERLQGRADRDLLQRDEELANAPRIAHVGNYALLLDTDETHFFDELCRILSCEPEEASLDRLLSAVHAEDRPRVARAVERALESETVYEQQYRVVRPDGSERYVLDRGEIDRDSEGKAIRVLGAVLDITETGGRGPQPGA